MSTMRIVVVVLLPMWMVACSPDGGTSIIGRKIVPPPEGGMNIGQTEKNNGEKEYHAQQAFRAINLNGI